MNNCPGLPVYKSRFCHFSLVFATLSLICSLVFSSRHTIIYNVINQIIHENIFICEPRLYSSATHTHPLTPRQNYRRNNQTVRSHMISEITKDLLLLFLSNTPLIIFCFYICTSLGCKRSTHTATCYAVHMYNYIRVPSVSRKQNSLTFLSFSPDGCSKFQDNYFLLIFSLR